MKFSECHEIYSNDSNITSRDRKEFSVLSVSAIQMLFLFVFLFLSTEQKMSMEYCFCSHSLSYTHKHSNIVFFLLCHLKCFVSIFKRTECLFEIMNNHFCPLHWQQELSFKWDEIEQKHNNVVVMAFLFPCKQLRMSRFEPTKKKTTTCSPVFANRHHLHCVYSVYVGYVLRNFKFKNIKNLSFERCKQSLLGHIENKIKHYTIFNWRNDTQLAKMQSNNFNFKIDLLINESCL